MNTKLGSRSNARDSQQHQQQPVHHAGRGAGDEHRPRDGEHLRHGPCDEPLGLSQGKHK